MRKELIERLISYIPNGDGYNSQYANDLADVVVLLEAKAAPVAYITGQFAGRCVIEAINRAAVLPTGMALYATPQPSAGVVMPDADGSPVQKSFLPGFESASLRLFGTDIRKAWNSYKASDEFARLNGKETAL